jgi:hypothetical protein
MRPQEGHREREQFLEAGVLDLLSKPQYCVKATEFGAYLYVQVGSATLLCCNLERSKDTLACSRGNQNRQQMYQPLSCVSDVNVVEVSLQTVWCNPSRTGV